MNVHDLLKEADIEEAPEGGEDRFAFLVTQAERRLTQSLRDLPDDNDSWREMNQMHYVFMNVVSALGKANGIDAFGDYALPSNSNYKGEEWADFNARLDHWITQHLVTKVDRARRDSIASFPHVREAIRTEVFHIRTMIDKADITDALRAKLQQRLSDFEKALDKDRLSLLTVSRVVIDVIALTSGAITVAESNALQKLLTKMQVTVGTERAEQDRTRALLAPSIPLIDAQPMPLKVMPLQQTPFLCSGVSAKRGFGAKQIDTFPPDLNDEIPF